MRLYFCDMQVQIICTTQNSVEGDVTIMRLDVLITHQWETLQL